MELIEAIIHAREVAEGCSSDNRDCAYQHDKLADWLEELQRYEHLEEQGRLIVLPRKIGTPVYFIAFDKCWNGKCCWIKDGKCSKKQSPEYCPKEVLETKYSMSMFLDKTRVFLNREEAESALKDGVD